MMCSLRTRSCGSRYGIALQSPRQGRVARSRFTVSSAAHCESGVFGSRPGAVGRSARDQDPVAPTAEHGVNHARRQQCRRVFCAGRLALGSVPAAILGLYLLAAGAGVPARGAPGRRGHARAPGTALVVPRHAQRGRSPL
jgi:hypothetical protein